LEVQRLEADAMAELHARVGELHALEAEAGRDLDERSDVPVGELIRAASHTIRLAAAQELARRFGISGSSVELRSWCELTGFGAQHLRRAETSDDAPTPESEA
jgi:hypothetical protein